MNTNKELNLPLFIIHILIQYSKPFTSIVKALVYTETINNNMHDYICTSHTYLQTN